MKVRLTQPGFETYTGQMGVIFFQDGLSTEDVLPIDAIRLCAVFGAEWEDGTPANIAQRLLDEADTPAQDVNGAAEAAAAQPATEAPAGEPLATSTEQPAKTYTEEELAAIADKDGIAGLRAISDGLGVKGNSIRGLIDAILKIAGTPKATA
ncbi:hypothetical protein C0Q88_07715 [Ralstonia pickettii]|uniref:Uncharacterized protein n=1 Tax=Ralstonia pickettii TaxID=329 RepID=A0A2N4TXZ4_RALPI|nr:hypothetical protein [Ralstonia pickettii]PLC44558.1 hypothetical protein C0Q88_07715 [Ralstonia pickettii]